MISTPDLPPSLRRVTNSYAVMMLSPRPERLEGVTAPNRHFMVSEGSGRPGAGHYGDNDMPHLLRFPRDLEARLERASHQTGITKAELIERLVQDGLTDLETQLLLEDTSRPRVERSIDQLLRESGLGA